MKPYVLDTHSSGPMVSSCKRGAAIFASASDVHKHVVLAGVFLSHAHHLDGFGGETSFGVTHLVLP